MYYSMPNYGYGCGCMPQYTCCGNNRGGRNGYSYALILVLFILLVIIVQPDGRNQLKFMV